MKLIKKDQMDRLLKNGQKHSTGEDVDFKPVVKLFTPDAGATWLLTEIDPEYPDQAFGLCDLGLGFPELGYVSMTEIRGVRGRLGLPVERDMYFKADKTLSEYSAIAHENQRIVA